MSGLGIRVSLTMGLGVRIYTGPCTRIVQVGKRKPESRILGPKCMGTADDIYPALPYSKESTMIPIV